MGIEEAPIGEGRINALRAIARDKGMDISIDELLIPEIEWLIRCAPLSDIDRRFAEYRFVKGYTLHKCGELLEWYSKNTPTKHNKKVSRILKETLLKLMA